MKKLLSTTIAVGIFASTGIAPIAFADVPATMLPSLGSASNADVSVNNSNMNITINGGQGGLGTLEWNSFNIGKDANVNYEFTAHNQTALNKVNASGGLSQIYGSITSSGCAGCGYDATGKVILLNPNGVLFGETANVNLNSFTVSTMNGVFDKDTNKLTLTQPANPSDFGIVALDGAKIHGGKAVNLASNKVTLYNGSKISTDVAPNYNGGVDSFGKVKIVTADGVNFAYYNNGAVKQVGGIQTSADKMTINLNGEINSGNIDVRNHSTNTASEINIKNGTLKATKAVSGNDGNIWLTANNNIIAEDAKLQTVNYSSEAASKDGGNIVALAGNKISFGTSDFDAVGDVNLTSQAYDVNVNNSTIDTAKDVNINAANIASIQKGSLVNAKNITVNGAKRAQINNSTVTATNDINLASSNGMVWTESSTLKAGNDINATATNGSLLLNNTSMTATKNNINLTAKDTISSARLQGSTFKAGKDVNVTSTGESIILTSTSQFKPAGVLNLNGAKNVEINAANDLTTEKTNIKAGENIFLTSANGSVNVKDTTKFVSGKKVYIKGAQDVKTTGTVDMNSIQTNIEAGRDIDVTLAGVANRNNGLVATAQNNMTVTTDGTLSVSSLISGKDMTINANKVIAGLPYTDKTKLPGDNSERSYIEVGGEFTSNVTTDNYEITQSGELTNDGKYNKKHHIQYGDEKILLVNKRPVENNVTDPNLPGINDGDDIDVINPDETPTDPTPSEPIEPSEPTDPSNPGDGGDNGDGGNTGGDDNTGDNQEPCPDVPNDDIVEDEDTPGLLSANDLLKYSIVTMDEKRF